MRGVPTELCMQAGRDWKDYKCSSIDALVPYIVRVPAVFLPLTLSIHRIKTRAIANKDPVTCSCLCAQTDTCFFWASTMPSP